MIQKESTDELNTIYSVMLTVATVVLTWLFDNVLIIQKLINDILWTETNLLLSFSYILVESIK